MRLSVLSVFAGAFWLATAASAEASAPSPSPSPPAEKPLIVVLNLETSGDIEPSDAELVAGLVAQALARGEHLEVVSADDIRRLADLEAQKQALGCDQSSCPASRRSRARSARATSCSAGWGSSARCSSSS